MSILKKRTNPTIDKDAAVPNLGMAYGMKKRAKFAKGGEVKHRPASHEGGLNMAAKDVNPRSTETSGGTSLMGEYVRGMKNAKHPLEKEAHKDDIRAVMFAKQLEKEDSSTPHRPLQGLAKGGLISQKAPKFAPVTGPFKVRDANFMKEEEHLVANDHGDGIEHAPEKMNEELEADKSGPSVIDMEREHSNGKAAYAEGGAVEKSMMPSDDIDHSEESLMHHASIVSAIMAKRKMMADGGEVTLTDNLDSPNDLEDRQSAALKENYDEDLSDMDQPEDSNEERPEHDEEDINDKSTVSAIRRKMRMKSPIVK